MPKSSTLINKPLSSWEASSTRSKTSLSLWRNCLTSRINRRETPSSDCRLPTRSGQLSMETWLRQLQLKMSLWPPKSRFLSCKIGTHSKLPWLSSQLTTRRSWLSWRIALPSVSQLSGATTGRSVTQFGSKTTESCGIRLSLWPSSPMLLPRSNQPS